MTSQSRLSSLYGSSYVVSENNTWDAIKAITIDPDQESSFYHLSIDELVRRVKLWRLKMPRVHPYYAVKCNDNPAVLKTLALLGTGFDCASRAEISKVTSLGVSPSRIIFAHPCKIASHIKYARAKEVRLMTFDSHEELRKLSKLFPESELVLRIRCDAASAQCQLGMKFGVQPEEARSLLQLAAKLNLRVVGVAFHVGSGCKEPTVFLRAIKAAKQVFVEAQEEGHWPTLLDIGGGFLGGELSTLDEASGYINTALEEHFPESLGVTIIAEPGCYMVEAAFTLATPIINRREMRLTAAEVAKGNPALADKSSHEMLDTVMYFIDDGVYGSFNVILYDNQIVTPVALKEFAGDVSISSVWGPTCAAIDQLVSAMLLPTALSVGDWLVWKQAGSYTLVLASNFNGFPPPSVKVHMNAHTSLYMEELLQQCPMQIASSKGSSGMCFEDESNSPRVDTRPSVPEDCTMSCSCCKRSSAS